ncbi:MAG: hypothetical protein ABEJ66_01235, partial [Candidatus Nanohaloarchaea archaeon]
MEEREEQARRDNEEIELPEGEGTLSDIWNRTREVVGNVTSGEERNASSTVTGSKSGAEGMDETDPSGERLRSTAARHAEQSRQSNRVVDEVVREENETLSQTALDVERELNRYLAHGEQDIPEGLEWEYQPERSLETGDMEVDNLLSYLSGRSSELDDVFEKIGHVDRSINRFRDQLEDVESELEERREEKKSEGERVLTEKQDRMTSSEARNSEIDDLLEFAEDVSQSKESHIQQDIDELEETKQELDRRVSSLEGVESSLYDARDEIIDEIEEVYEPHAEEMETVGHQLAEQLEEDVGYLEDLAQMDLANLTEEHGVKHVDDAANDLQNSREEAAYDLAERISEMAGYLADLQREHQDLVDLLPEQYLEDGEFSRVDTSIAFLDDLDERLSGSYDSFGERVDSAYEEATGESLY